MSTSYPLLDECQSFIPRNTFDEMHVEEERKNVCFTRTCQDYACISCLFLVGAILLSTGIALYVLSIISCLGGGILVVLGGLLLVVALSGTFFLCKNHCEHTKITALEVAIERKEREYDKTVERCGTWSNTRQDAHGDVWEKDDLTTVYQDLCKLYTTRESLEQCSAR